MDAGSKGAEGGAAPAKLRHNKNQEKELNFVFYLLVFYIVYL